LRTATSKAGIWRWNLGITPLKEGKWKKGVLSEILSENKHHVEKEIYRKKIMLSYVRKGGSRVVSGGKQKEKGREREAQAKVQADIGGVFWETRYN